MDVSTQDKPSVSGFHFVKTHCQICAAGQTIKRIAGGEATYCLLLREWMTDKHGNGKISGCDRFEVKDDAEG